MIRSMLRHKVRMCVFFFASESQNQKARQPAAALTSKRRRLHQQQPGVMLTSTHTGRSHTDIYTHTCNLLLSPGSTHPLSTPHPTKPTDTNTQQTLQNIINFWEYFSSVCSTYPITPESCASSFCLHTSEKWKMAEFRENQEQHSLHSLGRNLNGWKRS